MEVLYEYDTTSLTQSVYTIFMTLYCKRSASNCSILRIAFFKHFSMFFHFSFSFSKSFKLFCRFTKNKTELIQFIPIVSRFWLMKFKILQYIVTGIVLSIMQKFFLLYNVSPTVSRFHSIQFSAKRKFLYNSSLFGTKTNSSQPMNKIYLNKWSFWGFYLPSNRICNAFECHSKEWY